MKNYPEYPDETDALFRDWGNECGVKDFKRVLEVREIAVKVSILLERKPCERKLLLKFIYSYGHDVTVKKSEDFLDFK